jgi:hypothetical protein
MSVNGAEAAKHAGVKERVREEFRNFWIITLYLAVFFGSFTVYRRLILAEFGVSYLHYGFALVEALIIAKVILIGDAFGLGRRFEDRPLIYSVVFKSVLFGLFVMLFGVLEHVIEGLFHKKGASDILHGMMEIGIYELLARVVMLIIAFVPFFAFWELRRVLGPRKLSALFFSRRETS